MDSIDNGNGFGGAGDFGAASFGGSVEASSSGAGIGGGNGVGGASGQGIGTDNSGGSSSIGAGGSGDLGLGGPGAMETTAADYAALSTIAGAGLLAGFGMTGWSAATLAMANAIAAGYGTTFDVALGHLSHDIAASTAWGGMTALSSGQ